jgi:Xaa-Pro aminopeptidase
MDFAGRIGQAQRLMAERAIDLLAVSPGDDMRYLLGDAPHADERPCYLLVGRAHVAFVVPELNASQASRYVTVPTFTYTDAEGPAEAVAAALRSLGGRTSRLAVDDTMRADFVLTLREASPESAVVLGSQVLSPIRIRKSSEEIQALERSSQHADRAMRDAWTACRVGATETEIADVATASFRKSGSQDVLFTSVASGPNSAFPHYSAGDRRVRPGDAVTIDLSGRLDGYASDLTRTAVVGSPAPRYLEVCRTVEAAVVAALAVIRPGVPLHDVDRAARRVIEQAGFGPYFTHRTGHGLGLSGHELPSVTQLTTLPIDEGMVFSVEPGIYLPGEFGVRLEEIVYVAQDGPHILSTLPRDVHTIPAR